MADKRILEKVKKLHQLFTEGQIKSPEKHEVNPGLPLHSRENYLYFTLPCCLNFQRNSPAMWRSALNTFEDPQTRYLFFPEQVKERTRAEIQKDLTKYRLALQTNKHANIWVSICATLAGYYHSDPRAVLSENNFDVKSIIQTLQKEKKHLFPYLGGLKLSNYWLFILSRFTDAKFKNVQEISIIPDTHVIKSTIKLGLAEKGVKPLEVEKIWRVLLAEAGISPIEMHPVLWSWSRENFNPGL